MSRLETIANWLSVVAAFLFAGSVVLPDTTVGSPRSILIAIAGVTMAVVSLLKALANYSFRLNIITWFNRVTDILETERVGVNAPKAAKSPS